MPAYTLPNGQVIQCTVAELNEITGLITGQPMTESGLPKRGQRIQTATKGKTQVVVISAADSLPAPVKTAAKVIVAPSDAEKVQFGDKVIAIHKVRKAGEGKNGEWTGDYVQFTGFRGRIGDFTITMNQARLLADPEVQQALSAYMEKVG